MIALPKLLRPLTTAGAMALAAVLLLACSGNPQTLNVGFYAYFAPVSHSADEIPDSAGFNTHLGYEADLLTALESMDDAKLAFTRRAIPEWPGIWLLSAGDEFDIVGGGITILDSRTRDDAGNTAVAFTNGHITFRQSLLVRAEDVQRLAAHDALTSDVRVGALARHHRGGPPAATHRPGRCQWRPGHWYADCNRRRRGPGGRQRRLRYHRC